MLKLVTTEQGGFDLAADTALDAASAVETLIYAVLCSDAEAPPARVADRYERRGWWAKPAAGSGLWHVRRQALGSAARAETLAIITQALQQHGFTQVNITESSAGNISRTVLSVTGLHNERQFIVKVPV